MAVQNRVVQINPREAKTEALVHEYTRNKAVADAATSRNREIAKILAELAVYKDGSKTGHLLAGGFKITATIKENISWDQEVLEAARIQLGDDVFLKAFAWEFKPRSAKALHGFLDYAPDDQTEIIKRAMIVKPAQPSVKLDSLED
jgi:hypothetical protein